MDEHRHTYGVEPICQVLGIAPSAYWRYAARVRDPQLRSARAKSDEILEEKIQQVWQENMQVYGADKVWHALLRDGVQVARCTVERLMKSLGLQGARRGKVVKTTTPDAALPCPLDKVKRNFQANRPNQLWVSDVCLDPLHPAFVGCRGRTICRDHGRQLRQRLGRNHQRTVQNRSNSSLRPMENHTRPRIGNPRLGSLVQQQATF